VKSDAVYLLIILRITVIAKFILCCDVKLKFIGINPEYCLFIEDVFLMWYNEFGKQE
jgi:hypothetical protein